MNLKLYRFSDNKRTTNGILMIDDVFECFIVEDRRQLVKIKGETRIWEGKHQITYRQVLSGKTVQYRQKYPWFKWHLWIRNVPQFEFIYIHIGNDEDDTDGCLLTVDVLRNNTQHFGKQEQSLAAFRRLYEKVAYALDNNEEVWIEIVDLQKHAA